MTFEAPSGAHRTLKIRTRVQTRVWPSRSRRRWHRGSSTAHVRPQIPALWPDTRCPASFPRPADSQPAPLSLMERSPRRPDVAAGVPSNQTPPLRTRGLRPASRFPGRVCASQEESPFTGEAGTTAVAPPPRPPLGHLYARLQVCCAVYKKHTFSLLAKPHRQFRGLLCTVDNSILALALGF